LSKVAQVTPLLGFSDQRHTSFAASHVPELFFCKARQQLLATTTTMVRLKNRYLLVSILYPELENRKEKSKVPDVVSFNQPTTDAFTQGALLKGLRAEVANVFGDYGSGAVSESISGNSRILLQAKTLIIDFP
jgi:hypothetical protein